MIILAFNRTLRHEDRARIRAALEDAGPPDPDGKPRFVILEECTVSSMGDDAIPISGFIT